MKLENDNIMQRAEKALNYWDPDSMWARLIERDIDENDLESLQFHVDEAEAQQSVQESFSHDFTQRLLEGAEIGFKADGWPTVPMPEGIKVHDTF